METAPLADAMADPKTLEYSQDILMNRQTLRSQRWLWGLPADMAQLISSSLTLTQVHLELYCIVTLNGRDGTVQHQVNAVADLLHTAQCRWLHLFKTSLYSMHCLLISTSYALYCVYRLQNSHSYAIYCTYCSLIRGAKLW